MSAEENCSSLTIGNTNTSKALLLLQVRSHYLNLMSRTFWCLTQSNWVKTVGACLCLHVDVSAVWKKQMISAGY